MMLHHTANECREFARMAHAKQMYGEHPYIYHLDAVAEICKEYTGTWSSIVNLAYLHDIAEDTPYDIYDLFGIFKNKYLVECIRLLTDQPAKNRRIRKSRTNQVLSWIDADGPYAAVLVVKAADRLANMRETVKTMNREKYMMYQQESTAFDIAVYRENLCPEIWGEIDSIWGNGPLREQMQNLP